MDYLKPCPFCGAGVSEVHPNGSVWTGQRWGEPSSVSVRHWCAATPGQPKRMIERVGRDEISARAAWNLRWPPVFEPALLAGVERVIQREEPCMTCNGSGWVTRDPEIGTERECSVCDGKGLVSDA